MTWTLPDIPVEDDTPLVRQLVATIRPAGASSAARRRNRSAQGPENARPAIAPSRLEKPPRKPSAPGRKRPGSDKRSKTAQLTLTDEKVVPLVDKPPGSTFKGYEEYVVQDESGRDNRWPSGQGNRWFISLQEYRSVPLFWKGNGTISFGYSGETFPTTRRLADLAGPLE